MAYKQRWMLYFDHFDTNKNNYLDPADFAVIGAQIDKIFGGSPGSPNSVSTLFHDFFVNFIKDMDINKDGKVSREELIQGAEKSFVGKDINSAPAWWIDIATKVFNTMDANKNGELSLEETIKFVKLMNPKESDANIKHAFEWAVKLGSGKFDVTTFLKLVLAWANSPDPTPEADTLLPFFRDC